MAKITAKQLAVYAADGLQKGLSPQQISDTVASVLVSQRSSRDVLAFGRALETELHNRGVTQITVSSVHKVGDSVKQQLAEALGVKKPLFAEVIDPELIGGIKASTLESQLDLSVAAKLQAFKARVNEDK